MQKRPLTLLAALLLSLLLHFIFVAGGEIALPDFYSPPDEILESKKPGQVQQVSLIKPPPPATKKPAGLQFVKAAPAKKTKAAKKKKPKTPEPAKEEIPAQPAEEEQLAEVAAEEKTEEVVAPVTPEPPPAFPIQVNAQLEARVNGIPFTINQHWVMEGFRYAITQKAKKFGFSVAINSEGRINPEGGLSPELYQLAINDKVRSSCSYSNGEIRYGKVSNPKAAPLPVTPQDMASLPFHVATTFNGQPQSLFVCTGNSVTQVRLIAVAEEKIKLPAGTLRTLHLTGERFDDSLGQVVRGYEVWLALDYLNYPVKFIGHTSNGDRIEFRVKALELEGQQVLGARSDDGEDDNNATEIPEWVRERGKRESLNNP
ncbi:MAG: DUF3108 domain-containing protein [Pedobacter sp.]|nr:DUF3108 domain-containing protein [Pedobacter sp.]